MWISRAKITKLELENSRLRDEVGFLRGQIDQLQKASGGVVDVVERIVGQFVNPHGVREERAGESEEAWGEVALEDLTDWTDQIVPVESFGPVVGRDRADGPDEMLEFGFDE